MLRIWAPYGAAMLFCSLQRKAENGWLVTDLMFLPHIPDTHDVTDTDCLARKKAEVAVAFLRLLNIDF